MWRKRWFLNGVFFLIKEVFLANLEVCQYTLIVTCMEDADSYTFNTTFKENNVTLSVMNWVPATEQARPRDQTECKAFIVFHI